MSPLARRATSPGRFLALLLVVLLVGSGCWDRKEIEDIGFVLGMGLDQGPDGTMEITFQLANPRAISGGAGVGGGAGGGGQEKSPPLLVERIRETTVHEAVRSLEVKTNRRVSLVQLRVLVMGRKLAQAGLAATVGAIVRSREVRQTLMVMMADGTAEEILRLNPAMERDPSLFLEDLTRRAYERTAWAPRVHLHDFMVGYETLGKEPILPIVHASRTDPALNGAPADTKPELRGTVVFSRDRIACELTPSETEMLLMLARRSRSFVETLPLPDEPGRLLSLEVSTESQQVAVDLAGAEPRFTIQVRLEGEIREAEALPDRWATPDGIQRLGDALTDRLAGKANRLLKRLQQDCKADALGLGTRLQTRFVDYGAWERYDWPSHFPRATITAQIQTYIRRTGMTVKTPVAR